MIAFCALYIEFKYIYICIYIFALFVLCCSLVDVVVAVVVLL